MGAEVRTPAIRPVNLTRLLDMHGRGEKIAAIATYDATFAVTASRAGVECILVGADLAVAYQGHANQDDITLEALTYHVACVSMGLRSAQASAWVISDFPSGSSDAGPEVAMNHASRLFMAGAQMLRMNIDKNFAAVASFLTARGVAVCCHVKEISLSQCANTIQSIDSSGAKFVVLECMSDEAVLEISKALPQCVTIGLHSGQETTGQLLSLNDLLEVADRGDFEAANSYMFRSGSIQGALSAYVADVKENTALLTKNRST